MNSLSPKLSEALEIIWYIPPLLSGEGDQGPERWGDVLDITQSIEVELSLTHGP